jgi:hypothetical protein
VGRTLFVAVGLAAVAFGLCASQARSEGLGKYVTTSAVAESDIRDRHFNTTLVRCTPILTSSTAVHGGVRHWARFWCDGYTVDDVSFRLKYRVTGGCVKCWVASMFEGVDRDGQAVGIKELTRLRAWPPNPDGTCPANSVLRAGRECVPILLSSHGVPIAVCRDGATSYSRTRSGTCSWHGGVRTWLP